MTIVQLFFGMAWNIFMNRQKNFSLVGRGSLISCSTIVPERQLEISITGHNSRSFCYRFVSVNFTSINWPLPGSSVIKSWDVDLQTLNEALSANDEHTQVSRLLSSSSLTSGNGGKTCLCSHRQSQIKWLHTRWSSLAFCTSLGFKALFPKLLPRFLASE